MHELSLGRALLEQIASVMAQQRAVAVTRVTVRIGSLSGVEPALLRAAYEQLRTETVAENAELVITAMPVRIRCAVCDAVNEAAPNLLLCPQCGGAQTALIGGDEMLLESVDLVFQEPER